MGRWTFVLSDSVNYMPGTSTTGLSGVPGIGDLGLTPVQVGPDTGQGILTNYSNRIGNATSASIQRPVTGKTSFNAPGSYTISRFLSGSGGHASNSGLDSDSASGQGGINHQFNSRNSLGGNFAYSYFNYPGQTFGLPVASFASQTASLQYTRQLTRKFSLNASSGPEWTKVNLPGGGLSISLYADVSLAYSGRFSRMSLAFVRSTNGGSGVIGGTLADAVSFTTARTFARVWNCAFTAAYTHSSSLAGLGSYTFDTTIAGVQVSRAIGHSISGYASYTLENQSSQEGSAASAIDAFTGFSSVLGFGLTYSPMAIHLGHS